MSATTQTVQREEFQVGAGISTVILLYLLLFSITGSIVTADWSDDLGTVTFAAAGGVTLGILLGKLRRLPGFLAHLTMVILSVPATLLLGASLLPAALTLEEKTIVLLERVGAWIFKVLAGGSGTDNLIFVLQLCWMMWVIAYSAGWSIYRRHQVWGAIVPTGIAIVVNLFYAAPQTGLYIGLYIFCAMLLLVRLNLQAMERIWRSAAVRYSADISFDFLWNGAIVTTILLLVAWMIPAGPPSAAWLEFLEPLQTPWQGVEDQFNRLFSSLRGTSRSSSAGFFGVSLTMGGPINLTQRPVMDVQTLYGRYWRANVYDKYTGIGWVNTRLDALNLNANDPRLESFSDLLRVQVTQTVKLYVNDSSTLFAQSYPIRFDLPVEIRYSRTVLPDNPLPHYDVAIVRARRPLRAGTTYNAVSVISVADEESLRTDSIRYSDWITATYLQLPADLPARVRNLANTVTDQRANPYDKATALEKYVRNAIQYDETVSEPPLGRDGVDYTLFERPAGYCNYYASALAVMARAIGIPARVVSGYSLGNFANGTFHIVEANAHSWVEMYFPAYGWVEFEATANKPEIERPKRQNDSARLNPELEDAASEARRRQAREKELDENDPGAVGGFTSYFWNDPNTLALVGGAIAGIVALVTLSAGLIRQLRRHARLAPAARLYERMLDRARWLGIHEQKFATPLERAQTISNTLPKVQRETEHIASFYTRERFGAHKLDDAERESLTSAWSKWSGEWRSGVIARIIERVQGPFRAMVERLRAIKQRIERMR